MERKKESYHLMAVPRHFTSQVIQAGGRFLKIKQKQWTGQDIYQMIQQRGEGENRVHILDPEQHRTYEMLSKEYVEDISLCNTVFEQHREEGYRTFQGGLEMVNCEDCLKKIKKITPIQPQDKTII